MFKFTLIAAAVLFPFLYAGAQTPFYWYGDQKIYVTPDSTKFYVELSKTTLSDAARKKSLAARFQLNDTSVEEMSPFQFVIHSNKNIRASSMNVQDDNSIEHLTPFLKTANSVIFLRPYILVGLKEGHSIDEIIASFSKSLTVVDSMGYNTYRLNCIDKDYTQILNLSDRIHDYSNTVLWCEPDFYGGVSFSIDPLYPNQYFFNNTGQYGGTAGIDMRAVGAWAISTGSPSVRLAIVDAGQESHEDLAGRVLSGYTIGGGTGAPQNGSLLNRDKSHGMATAGIAAASHNELGVRGVAPGVVIVPVNISPYVGTTGNPDGIGSNGDIAAAIDWAWNPSQGNASILSNSWNVDAPSSAIDAALQRARTQGRANKGCPVVFSAGNWQGIPYSSAVKSPADGTGIITVGAVDKFGSILGYSCAGPSMDVVAVSGPPAGDMATTDRMGTAGDNAGNYLATFNGTSAACPQVAGTAALMLSVNSALTETDTRTILQSTATDMGPAGFDNSYGYGRLNACLAVAAAYLKSVSISGNASFCSSSTYSISLLPGFIAVWSVSGHLAISGSNTVNPVTIVKSGDGTGTLSVSITSPCGVVTGPTKSIYAGLPIAPSYTTSPNPLCAGSDGQLYYNLPAGQAIINATGTQGGSQIPLSLSSNSVYIPGNIVQITITVQNSCGSKNFTSLIRKQSCLMSSGRLSLYPNPANSQVLVVQPIAGDAKHAYQPDTKKSVQLITKDGIVLQTATMINGKASLNTYKVANGTYYVRIAGGDAKDVSQIIIQH